MFPSLIKIGSMTINIYGIFVGLAIFFGIFVFWNSARKEGFDKEKVLDFSILSLAVAFLISRLSALILSRFNFNSAIGDLDIFLGIGAFLIFSYLFIKREQWSLLKIGDKIVPAVVISLSVLHLGLFFRPSDRLLNLIFTFIFIAAYGLILAITRRKIKTGFVLFYGGIFILGAFWLLTFAERGFFGLTQISALAFIIFTVLELKKRLYYFEDLKNMKEILKAEFLEKLKGKLVHQQAEVEAQEKKLAGEDPFLEPNRADSNAEMMDEADEEIGHSWTQSTLSSLTETKDQIIKALARFKSGSYGTCEKCKEPIDKARLEAFPAATYCLKCEEHREDKATDEETQ